MAGEPRLGGFPAAAGVRLAAAMAVVLATGGWLLCRVPVPLEVPGVGAVATPSLATTPDRRPVSSRPYVVVDRRNNRLWLRNGQAVLMEAVVSTGSGAMLREEGGDGRTWRFETPAGRYTILSVRHVPVWVKPDWAFVEEGRPIPARPRDRYDPHALGEYALDLGNGYLIHGTLYERLLGRSVTHGCIRVGRDDLRRLVAQVGPGTHVFIF